MNAEMVILLSIITFLTSVILHILICRLSSAEKFMLKGLVVGIIGISGLFTFQLKSGVVNIVVLYLSGTLWLGYLMFFINLLNSITLRMLEKLAKSPKGELFEKDFQEIFSSEQGVQERLEAMKINGFLVQSGKNLKLSTKALRMVQIVKLLRKTFSMSF